MNNFIQIPKDSYTLLQTIGAQYPEAKEITSEIEGNLTQSLWHQLSENLNTLASIKSLQQGTVLMELYNGLIVFVETALNPMKLLSLIHKIASTYKDKESLIFVENIEKKIKFKGEENLYIKIIKGYCHLRIGNKYEVEDIITLIGKEFEVRSEIDTVIYSNYYRLCTEYYEKYENYDLFYINAFQYLAYKKDLSKEEELELCFKMCIASLIGEKMFNFAELIEKDFFKLMKDSNKDWIYNLILSFNSSNVNQFVNMLSTYQQQISQTILKDKIDFLKNKIRIAALLDLVFKKNKNERTITYEEIKNNCIVNDDGIELLVMKALSLELIKGHIDQVDKKVIVNWIQPKYLDIEKITFLRDRFKNWIDKSDEILKRFQDIAQPLLNN